MFLAFECWVLTMKRLQASEDVSICACMCLPREGPRVGIPVRRSEELHESCWGLSRPLPLHMEARSCQPTPWCRPMWPRSYPSSCWESMAPPYLWNARPDPLGVGPLFRRYDWPLHGGREVGHPVAGTMRGPLARLALCLATS